MYKSLYKVKLPATIGKKEILIETDVVKSDIPMLLSKSAMKKADTRINFKDDTVNMLWVKQDIIATTSGHYAVPLNKNKEIFDDISRNGSSIVLHADSLWSDKMKIARKLHAQFSHPEKSKFMRLIKSAGLGNDAELIVCVNKISDTCQICQEYKKVKTSSRCWFSIS